MGDAGGHQFRDAALDDALDRFGIFELFANCHFVARLDQTGQIAVQRVVREARQFHVCGCPIAALSQNNFQGLSRFYRILAECLIKIPHSEKQQSLRVLRLKGIVLTHERGFFGRF